MSLEPDRVERLRKKLYEKAKREPDFRFYSLHDKVCRIETLERAYRQAKANAGAAGVDGVRFEDIEAYGVERWLAELRQELVEETYRPHPVRRVMIPKPGGGERPLGIPGRLADGRVAELGEIGPRAAGLALGLITQRTSFRGSAGLSCRDESGPGDILGKAYSAFVAVFREAADKLKAGNRTARFPLGSFPPALLFVSAYPGLPP